MTVACPKCRTKLKIPDEKVSPDGTRFRCPRCSTILLVKKRIKKAEKIRKGLVLFAHSDEELRSRGETLLKENGFEVITASDGIDAMVKAMRELPEVLLVDVALPKIYGFEVCKRIKERKETSEIKVVLIASIYDRSRYRRPPQSLYGADDYIEEPEFEEELIPKILALREGRKEKAEEGSEELASVKRRTEPVPEEKDEVSEEAPGPTSDQEIERARRLARTVISDIYLYNPQKVTDSIREGSFREVFQSQLSEGLKLYNLRISPEVRARGDFFNEEIEKFLQAKREELGL